MSTPILVTGAAGFIGHAVAHRLLARGERVIGIDIVNDYYDPASDVTATYADVSKLHKLTGYKPKVMLAEGLEKFVDWYRKYYRTEA